MDWLIFAIFMLVICLGIGGFFVWLNVMHAGKGKRKRKKRRHHRPTNPTLAQTGGLPRTRDPNQPPPGP